MTDTVISYFYATPRFARVIDAPAVLEILQSCELEIPIYDSVDLEQVRKDCKSKQYWVVESESNIVGLMKLEANEIFFLAVGRKYRKQGYARSLISTAKKRCSMRRWSHLKAKTRKDNIPTIALLESEGFLRDRFARVSNPEWLAYAWHRKQ
jgi:ribosomal protein S18 acetylase RimI-like enzyme